LDGQSEAHVQRALDNASKGRLTITIGHRLSAIKGADVIFVMEQGVIVETGSHEELVERGGRYFELIQAQL
jgi:ATP-binding cassette subfamily B (MDR/TAP) protein 1